MLFRSIAATTETRVVTSQQLPLRLREVKNWPTLAEFLGGQEKQYIDHVLHQCKGDKAIVCSSASINSISTVSISETGSIFPVT